MLSPALAVTRFTQDERWFIQPAEAKATSALAKRLAVFHRSPFRRPGRLGLSAETRWLCVPSLRKVCHCRAEESLQGLLPCLACGCLWECEEFR